MLSRLALRNAQTLSVAIRGLQTTSSTSNSNVTRPVRLANPSPVRYTFIPEEWFTFFYPKTGVTGPYMFILSLGTYLVSKEIYVLEHEYYNGLSFLIMWIFFVKKFGPTVSARLEKEQDNYIEMWESHRRNQIESAESQIAAINKSIWSAEGQTLMMEAKRENIKIQLEAIYRERIAHVYTEVKKRLDYNAQIQAVERRIAHKHMIQWIINSVIKAITPEQEKAALQQCILDLEGLAARA